MSTPLLDLNKCTIRFGGLTAVSAVDMQIGPQDLLGLIGPNGAGKTTVFNIITGVYQPTSGTITFNNKPTAGLKPNVIAKRGIARTFQNIRLFPTLSVYDNVRAAFNLRLRHRLAHALDAVSLFLSRGKPDQGASDGDAGDFWAGARGAFALRQPSLRRSTPARDRARPRDAAEAPAARRTGGRA